MSPNTPQSKPRALGCARRSPSPAAAIGFDDTNLSGHWEIRSRCAKQRNQARLAAEELGCRSPKQLRD
jgi:hypothetical protein